MYRVYIFSSCCQFVYKLTIFFSFRRYFDIRVAEKNGQFYFVHGLYGELIENILIEVRRINYNNEIKLI